MLEISLVLFVVLGISVLLFRWTRRFSDHFFGAKFGRVGNLIAIVWSGLLAILLAVLLVGAAIRELSSARTWQSFGRIVARVHTSEPVVALTFDDGPEEQATTKILEVLKQLKVKATFFVNGAQLKEQPESGRSLLQAGHELGNHSYSHTRMIGRSAKFVREEIERTDRLIRKAGHEGPIWFRPPYFKKLITLPWFLQKTGRMTVTADIEPEYDAANPESVDSMVRHVLDRVQPGSIILLHVMYGAREKSRAAVPGIVKGLHDRGFRFVTVSELLKQVEY